MEHIIIIRIFATYNGTNTEINFSYFKGFLRGRMRIPPLFYLYVLIKIFPCPPCDPWIKNFCETLDLRQPINHLLAVVAILPITHVNPEGCALDARTLEDELVKLLIHQPT